MHWGRVLCHVIRRSRNGGILCVFERSVDISFHSVIRKLQYFVTDFCILHSTRAVFYMAVAMLTSELLSPPLGSLLMSKYGPYAPYLSGIPLEMLGFIILYLLPASETSAKNDPITFQVIDTTADHGRNTWPRRIMITSVMHTRTLATYLVNRPGLLVLLLAFMVNKLSRQIEEIMIQYVTVRFGWTLAQVGMIQLLLTFDEMTLYNRLLTNV